MCKADGTPDGRVRTVGGSVTAFLSGRKVAIVAFCASYGDVGGEEDSEDSEQTAAGFLGGNKSITCTRPNDAAVIAS